MTRQAPSRQVPGTAFSPPDALSGAPTVILTTPDELRALVSKAVTAALAGATPASSTLLSRQGCAEWLGTTVRTLDNLRSRGLPCVFVGDSPRFEPAEVMAWLRLNPPAGVAGSSKSEPAENTPDPAIGRPALGTGHRAQQCESGDFTHLGSGGDPRAGEAS